MSIPRQFEVCCPKCGKSFIATAFESINSDFAPNVAEQIISGERFNAKCPKCGNIAHLEYDVLYHDMNHGAMIWVIHENNKDYDRRISEIRSNNLIPYNTTRIVPDINALREKVACLESEKDDRVVELCKFFLSAQLMQQKPDFEFRNAFYTYANGRDIVYFYDDSGTELGCDLNDNIYDMISSMFSRPLKEMDDSPYQIIDSNWAEGFFELLPENAVKEYMNSRPSSESVSEDDESIDNKETPEDTEKTIIQEECCDKPIFCRKCGARLLSDSIFCSYCETKVII